MPVTNDFRAKVLLCGSHTWNVFESKDVKLQTFQVKGALVSLLNSAQWRQNQKKKSKWSAAVVTDTGWFMLLIKPSSLSYLQNIQ